MKTRISTYQTALLLVVTILATSIVFLPELIITRAKQDAWIAIILLIGFMGVISLIYTLLTRRMGSTDLINFNRRVLGRVLTIPLGLGLIAYFLISSGVILRETSEIMVAVYMPETPLWFFILTGLLTAAAFVYYGLEVMARSFEILFYLYLVAYLFAFLIVIKDLSLSFLRPMLAEGIKPILQGAYPGLLFFGELFLILLFAPQMSKQNQAHKSLLGAIGIIGTLFLIAVISSLALFGAELASNLTFPVLSVHRYAEALGFLERLDPLFIFYWIGSGIIKTAIFFYGGIYIGQKLLGLSTYYALIPFALPPVFYTAFYYFQNVAEIAEFLTTAIPYYLFIQVFYPLLLLIISLIRGIKAEEGRDR
ncbi:GerAB/ArcD/ProY family transporter [Acetohalobium arabaticum]|uniref:Spore germination protein n=1 Tax=Acetohalobium arabaticum (strain ATCC 49924 / DSM 5501 / Z-7288) TaxID=574087 RepID=D9QRA9_ACEAZ|nr:GerAB/ArcD/ProY family transporter [Acetohalobium arabaticum]ADL13050.1 spore germination protein [Acetohalobium arabaticum DSM 5501]